MGEKVYLTKTASGKEVYICKETMEHMQAHPDVKFEDIKEAVEKLADYNGPYFIGSVDMGRVVGKDNCIKANDNACYLYRKNRDGLSHVVLDTNAKPMDTRLMTVGVCLDDDGKHTLFTAFTGQLAPKEPWDKSLSPEEAEKSRQFWEKHALVCSKDSIDWKRARLRDEFENIGKYMPNETIKREHLSKELER